MASPVPGADEKSRAAQFAVGRYEKGLRFIRLAPQVRERRKAQLRETCSQSLHQWQWSGTIPLLMIHFSSRRTRSVAFSTCLPRHPGGGKVTGGNRENIPCNGGRAALGLAVDFDASDELLDRYAAIFSQGLQSVSNQEAYRDRMEAVPMNRRSLYEYGIRGHCNAELA